MQDGTFEQRVARAKELLGTVRHAAIATINPDGSPHNTPVFATWDDDLNFYWGSDAGTQHSQNIARDGRVFVVLYDSFNRGGGLYVQANARELAGDDLERALKVVNQNRARWGRPPVDAAYYSGDRPQRLYKAERTTAWVNVTSRDEFGQVANESRQQVTPKDFV